MLKANAKLPVELRERISAALKPLHPKKVILFGSYAWGRPTQESDIDLVVVLDSEAVSATYHEKMTNRLNVRRALDNVNRDYALDVLVYTAPEWKAFQDMGSAFSKELVSRGIEV
ncbi:MAG: nucleotidyltransferase domain-containing protein [Phycisphaerales bacterium]|nr:MAG: nucleotidyltransferase domain-containing protein [Phycisphaerales bacterium]